MKHIKAFTLIELLIVVAIIAILAAIAVPNFLEAQTRAKVSRVKADMRSMGIAIESYRLDNNHSPYYQYLPNNYDVNPTRGYTPTTLTTPIAYITSLPTDPFAMTIAHKLEFPNPLLLYDYESREHWNKRAGNEWDSHGPAELVEWVLVSIGPDLKTVIHEPAAFHGNLLEVFQEGQPNKVGVSGWYDPTNGTVSRGDILGFGPGPRFEFPGEFSYDESY